MDSREYNADSIKILDPKQAEQRFEWLQAENLAAQYSKPLEFVQRGIEACRRSSTDLSFFIQRYLEGDKSGGKSILLEEAFLELMTEAREKSQFKTQKHQRH
jgi:hypothetical protein